MKENPSLHKLQQLCQNVPHKTSALKVLHSFPRLLLCAPIRLYQLLISPLLPQHCRFYPRCSEYSLEALKKYGVLRGSAMAFCRIVRCHPWNLGGYDPVAKSPESKHLCRKEQSE